MKKRAVNALIWMLIILVVGSVFLFIIPEFKKEFDDWGSELPTSIHVVISISDFLSRYWYAFIPPTFLCLGAYVIVPTLVRKPEHPQ